MRCRRISGGANEVSHIARAQLKALVVFHGGGRHWLAPLLAPGFAHVAVMVEAGAHWVLIDPGLGTPDVRIVEAERDIARECRDQGWAVVETECRDIQAMGPLMLNNCVGVVKKVLGIRHPFVWTPFQLFNHLRKQQ